jgi:AbrB family looped-hinge helix DNA binding protein
MSVNVIVSSRGQITLPAEIRKKYKMEEGEVLVIEERNGELILKPAKVFEVEYYSDSQINEWEAQDSFASGEKEKFLEKLGAK